MLAAMIAYLLLRLTQVTTYCAHSLQQISRLICLNLTTWTSLLALLHPCPNRNSTRRSDSEQLCFLLADT